MGICPVDYGSLVLAGGVTPATGDHFTPAGALEVTGCGLAIGLRASAVRVRRGLRVSAMRGVPVGAGC